MKFAELSKEERNDLLEKIVSEWGFPFEKETRAMWGFFDIKSEYKQYRMRFCIKNGSIIITEGSNDLSIKNYQIWYSVKTWRKDLQDFINKGMCQILNIEAARKKEKLNEIRACGNGYEA